MTNPGVEFRQVFKHYGKENALQDISFTVSHGEHTAIIGPSGCGKSTTLRLFAGLEAPSNGTISMNGEVVSKAGRILKPPHLRGVGMVFQDLALWSNLSVLDNVRLGLSGQSLSRQQARERADQALALSGIENLRGRKPGTLSGGQQQRVALARAIATRPTFLLLDEPFSGLDLVLKKRLLAEISKLAEKQNLTLILVSHDPLDALGLCRFAVVLTDGRVAETGKLTELLEQPRSETLKIFRDHLKNFR